VVSTQQFSILSPRASQSYCFSLRNGVYETVGIRWVHAMRSDVRGLDENGVRSILTSKPRSRSLGMLPVAMKRKAVASLFLLFHDWDWFPYTMYSPPPCDSPFTIDEESCRLVAPCLGSGPLAKKRELKRSHTKFSSEKLYDFFSLFFEDSCENFPILKRHPTLKANPHNFLQT